MLTSFFYSSPRQEGTSGRIDVWGVKAKERWSVIEESGGDSFPFGPETRNIALQRANPAEQVEDVQHCPQPDSAVRGHDEMGVFPRGDITHQSVPRPRLPRSEKDAGKEHQKNKRRAQSGARMVLHRNTPVFFSLRRTAGH